MTEYMGAPEIKINSKKNIPEEGYPPDGDEGRWLHPH